MFAIQADKIELRFPTIERARLFVQMVYASNSFWTEDIPRVKKSLLEFKGHKTRDYSVFIQPRTLADQIRITKEYKDNWKGK